MTTSNATPSRPEKALELLAGWLENETTIGMLFTTGAKSTIVMRTRVQRASAGRLELFDREHPAGASFMLSDADFQYGPVLTFPRWPLPPPVKIQGLSAWWPDGHWLFLWDARSGSPAAIRESEPRA